MKINSNLIRKLRAERQWSQEHLADVCELSLRTIQRLETTGKASLETVRILAAVFEIDANKIILDNDDKTRTPIDVIKSCFLKYADFSDRATRYEYWWFFIFVLLTAAIAEIIHESAYKIVMIIFLLPLIAVGTRRLNDAGQSRWIQLLFLVPFAGIVVLFMYAMDSQSDQPKSEININVD